MRLTSDNASEKLHTKDNREIQNTLDKLNFIIFCETMLKGIETQTDIEESQLYKLWQQR